jgi:(4S)-4-hydroxy-5-phosphonooxypentane-2,3-dione isomerase
MYVVCVHVHVKSEHREAFLAATLENAGNTIQEPGNLRFDVNQSADDLDRFMLYEVYVDEAGSNAHKGTPHYAKWRDTVANWMAEPRQGIKYQGHFPVDQRQWRAAAGK